ncbi:hypothetical protein Tco_0397515 [Tanacetum coccineum]
MKDLWKTQKIPRDIRSNFKQGNYHGILERSMCVLDLLAEIGMVDCKPADTPMIVNQKLYMEKKALLADKGKEYQRWEIRGRPNINLSNLTLFGKGTMLRGEAKETESGGRARTERGGLFQVQKPSSEGLQGE